MGQRIPECFRRLARQGAPGSIGDGAGNHDRNAHVMAIEILLDGEQRGLGVQRIENGFHHQQIRSAIQQAAYGFGIAFHQLIEIDVAETGIVYVR